MNKITGILIVGLVSLVCVIGCESIQPNPAPKNLTDYSRMGKVDRKRYSDTFVVQYNLARIHNDELPTAQRLDSLKLVAKLGTGDQTALSDLATLLRDQKCPAELSKQVLRFLLTQNQGDLAAYVIPLLPELQKDPKLRKTVLEWMKKNSVPQMLADLVQTWAYEQNVDDKSSAEKGYRDAVRQISGKPWNVTLLDELNSPTFPARSDAYEVLRRRISPATLRNQILSMRAKTETVVALKNFIDAFDYLPLSGEDLRTGELVFRVRRDMLPNAAKLYIEWNKSYKYRFDIRDFHLLSRLARDPLRTNHKRTQLILQIGKALRRRKHVKHSAAVKSSERKDSFWLLVDKLSMADLWNIYLIDEMLSRPRVQKSLRLMANGDLADSHSAWGGLLFYQNGQAEAILYPPDAEVGSNDLTYLPTQRLITDGRDSLCRFTGHFDKIRNADRAGPSDSELKDANTNNFFGLTLTRLSKNSFCAHYYNPAGVVVSLGRFKLR